MTETSNDNYFYIRLEKCDDDIYRGIYNSKQHEKFSFKKRLNKILGVSICDSLSVKNLTRGCG